MYGVDIYKRCQRDDLPREIDLISQYEERYKKYIYELYVSHTQADIPGMVGNEVIAIKPKSAFSKLYIFVGVVCICIFSYSVYSMSNYFSDINKREDKKELKRISKLNNDDIVVKKKEIKLLNKDIKKDLNIKKNDEKEDLFISKYSSKWRVVGSIISVVDDSKNVIILSDGNTLRKIELDNCNIYMDEYECIVDDKVVTGWTANKHNSNNISIGRMVGLR